MDHARTKRNFKLQEVLNLNVCKETAIGKVQHERLANFVLMQQSNSTMTGHSLALG